MCVHQGAFSGTIHLTLRTLALAPTPIKDIGAVPCKGTFSSSREHALILRNPLPRKFLTDLGIGGFPRSSPGPPDPLLVLQALVRTGARLPIFSSGGLFGSGPNRNTLPHLALSVGRTSAMAHGRSSHQNLGSQATRSRQSRADSRDRVPPVDVAIAPTGGPGDVPAAVVPATAQEMAELRGQVQHLVGIC
ncbi:hypothetical protein Taro_021051 [Colocasia esculenta]|uniref:Uncharacterized protein n=1 Tax=Colocasia esculenta TaxID=4460 RepID=A0A843V484_COLES|nr:hypothetical protein [Colocasia esculenta]